MLIPPHDGFAGYCTSTTYGLFDAGSNIEGPLTIETFGANT